MRISVVSTLYKSSPYIAELVQRIRTEVSRLTDDFEIILVDDGSPDDSLRVALAQMAGEPRLRIIELSRNFGHYKAMMTGLEHADGDFVFLIDADLEEPPELLGSFYERLTSEELDVVYGFQEARKGRLAERLFGWIAWKMMGLMLPIRIPPNHSTVRLMTRDYVQALVRHKESKTAVGGLWVITGFRQAGLAFHKGSRETTSYSFVTRLFTLLDSITSFSEMPLYFVFCVGLLVLLISAVIACWLVIRKLTGQVLAGWVSTLFSVWFLGGLAIFSIGVVGLYVSRIFVETKNRPYTIIRKIHGQ
ncbi:MAG TPA: glycosyltransferase family 2 protein [Thermoanaerobaculia bacterium]|jgi:putative glycosyltransferase|nr:glycosyltransferase family 2 protein [Thermoanaerobaculia bacterium]